MKSILTPRVFIASVIIACLLLCGTLAYILVERPALSNANLGSASSDWTIIPALTSTPRPLPPTYTAQPPTPRPTVTPGEGQIFLGAFVQPATGGEGLRVHTQPALDAPFFAAFDSEVFQVANGPQQADGYTWWFLTASYDSERSGWAVEDFLIVIPSQ